MADGPGTTNEDPAEQIGDAVAQTVSTVQADAAAAVESAEERAQRAAETAEHLAQAARESAIGQEMQRHREEMGTWRADLESRLSQTEAQVASLPETIGSQLAATLDQFRAQLQPNPQGSTPQPTSTDPASVEPPATEAAGDGPRASPAADAAPRSAPPKRRHVL